MGLVLCLLTTVCARPGTRDVTGDGRVRVACWGDSNTARRWTDGSEHDRWCEYLQAEVPATWDTVNCGSFGMTAGRLDFLAAGGWAPCATDNTDAVVIALGTVDIGRGRTAGQVAADVAKLADLAATDNMPANRLRRVLVLAIPHRRARADLNAIADDTNRLLRIRFGDRLVQPREPPGTSDITHLDDASQRARADAVWDALRR